MKHAHLTSRLAAGCCSLAGLLIATAPPAEASFQVGWRARPTRVTYLPPATDGAGAPELRVRIEGMMTFAEGPDAPNPPLAPRCGAVDFFCRGFGPSCTNGAATCQELCRREWEDIAAAARDGRCVAFSARLWVLPDKAIRPLGSPVETANPYDPVMGVVTIPCHPEMPSATRPDLGGACAASPAEADAGGAGPVVPGPDPADAAAKTPADVAASQLPGLTPGPGPGADAAAAAGAPPSQRPRGGGCAAGGRAEAGGLAGLLALAGLLVARRRRRP
jgi:hypothetical protein